MVTVEKAIKKGHKMVTYPGLLIIFALTGTCFYLDLRNIISTNLLFLGVAFSLFICWLYWSFMITKWRRWAAENVEDLEELEHRAIKEMLVKD